MNSWINIDAENVDELKKLFRDYGIDREFVDYPLDRNERAYLDYDKATDVLLIFNWFRHSSPNLYRWVMNAVRYEGYRW
ncbi:MAG: hypothetical protein ACLTXM_03180 [Enterococcus sp.]